MKKIIIKACAVTITLYVWSSPIRYPGCPNSVRIKILRDVPTIPDQAPRIKYKVPISLWLVENNHRCDKMAEVEAIDCKSFYGKILLSWSYIQWWF